MITVVGGANVDIIGTADKALIGRDSNPGRVIVTPGGVGRNMAERFCALGHDVRLITALGEDAHAQLIKDNCKALGVDLALSRTVPGAHTSTYLCINGPDGDLALAVSDMEVCHMLTPEFLEAHLDAINDGALCVLDANLSVQALTFLASRVRVPMVADPVSVAKAERLIPILDKLALIKPNIPEAERLTGLTAARDGLAALARALLTRGISRVFLSLGAQGAYHLDVNGGGSLPCYPGPVIDTTGCGDAFLAAAASAMLDGMDAHMCAQHALAAAALQASRRPYGRDAILEVIRDGGIYR